MTEIKICPYCAEEIKAEAIVCRYCSNDLRVEPPDPEIEEQKTLKKKKRLKIILLSIFAVLVLCRLSCWIAVKDPFRAPFGYEKVGDNLQIVLEEDVEWIAYISDATGKKEIHLISPDGRYHHKITHNTLEEHDMSWSPDGSKVAFAAHDSNQACCNTDIYVVNIDGSNMLKLTDSEKDDISYFSPAWSPDGKQIAYVGGSWADDYQIFVMSAKGRSETKLTDSKNNFNPAWSPDGNLIVFSSQVGLRSEIFTIEPNGKNLKQLTDDTRENTSPKWSPDGSKIAYLSSENNFSKLYIINADGSDPYEVVNEKRMPDIKSFEWSTAGDGWDLAISIANDTSQGKYYYVILKVSHSSNAIELASSDEYVLSNLSPSWAPDDHRLAYIQSFWQGDECCYSEVSISHGPSSFEQITFDRDEVYEVAWVPIYIAPNPSATRTMAPSATLVAKTPTPRNTPEPILNIDFYDDFSTISDKWAESDDDPDYRFYYQNGKYYIEMKKEKWMAWSNPGFVYDDVIIDVDINFEGGSDNNNYGVLCRFNDRDNFYRFAIGSDQYYSIYKQVDDDWVAIQGWQKSTAINKISNHLTARCVSNQLSMWVNGTHLVTAYDDTFVDGNVALFAGVDEGDYYTLVSFDNFHSRPPD